MERGSLPAACVRLVLVALCLASLARPVAIRAASPLTVFAAASLTEALSEVAEAFSGMPDAGPVRFQFAGSQQLARHIEDGAAADILATADEHWMAHVRSEGHLQSPASPFARNLLVVITPAANPTVRRLRDLALPGKHIVLAAESVPAGRYSRELLRRLSTAAELGGDYEHRVLANVVSLEDSVKGVVAKVQLDEADAGIVYRSDVTETVAGRVRVVEVAETYNVTAQYYAAVLRGARDPDRAQRFVDFLSEPQARAILERYGFVVDER